MNNSILSSIVINGDLSKLTNDQKAEYYNQMCANVGLNPLSLPFKLLRLNGKEILYCDRSGAQQLNKLHSVSHTITARETVNGCYVVTAQASLPNGRHTESIGAVSIENLKGDQLCNSYMRAETKAKRRATLDLLGLGVLDETEVETIKGAEKVELPVTVPSAPAEAKQGEISPTAPAPAAPDNSKEGVNTLAAPIATMPAVIDKFNNPFKRKYATAAEIELHLVQTRDVKDVAALYYVNAEAVESNTDLKAAFSYRRNKLYQPAAA